MKKQLSIIVPVYNVEKYIDKCLYSLVNQTLESIEIIVVNDGSPDNSQKIIDKYVMSYPDKVRSFIKKNGGLSDARNYGIEKAIGKYIAFLDSDDYVEPTMYEKLYNKAINKNFDMVVCDVNYVFNDRIIKVSSNVRTDTFDNDCISKYMTTIYPAAWNKIFRKELFSDGIKFKKGIWFEDVEFIYRLFPKIKSIGVVKEELINYVQRDGTITKTYDDRLYDYIDNWNGIIDYYKSNGLYKKYEKELEYCYVRYVYGTFIKQATNFEDQKDYFCAVDKSIIEVNKKFPNYKKNKYFYQSKRGIYLLIFNKFVSIILWMLRRSI